MPKSLDPLPYFKWMWRDWRANRKVQRMNYVARGLYRELLDEQWSEGSIPNELSDLAEICGCPFQIMDEHWEEIRAYFQEREDGRLFNLKLEQQRTELDSKRVKLADAGRAGANAKQKLANAEIDDMENSMLLISEVNQQKLANAEQMPYSISKSISRAEHKQENVSESFSKNEDSDMNAITEIKKICATTMGLDIHIWDSEKAKIKEHMSVHGGTYVTRMFQEWAEENAGTVRKNPVGEFLKVASGLFAGTFALGADKKTVDITNELTYLSGNKVIFSDAQKALIAKQVSEGAVQEEIQNAFRSFWSDLNKEKVSNIDFAAKTFVDGLGALIYGIRKDRSKRLSETSAIESAKLKMQAEAEADRIRRAEEAEREAELMEEGLPD